VDRVCGKGVCEGEGSYRRGFIAVGLVCLVIIRRFYGGMVCQWRDIC